MAGEKRREREGSKGFDMVGKRGRGRRGETRLAGLLGHDGSNMERKSK